MHLIPTLGRRGLCELKASQVHIVKFQEEPERPCLKKKNLALFNWSHTQGEPVTLVPSSCLNSVPTRVRHIHFPTGVNKLYFYDSLEAPATSQKSRSKLAAGLIKIARRAVEMFEAGVTGPTRTRRPRRFLPAFSASSPPLPPRNQDVFPCLCIVSLTWQVSFGGALPQLPLWV